jgi:hypothetical protein
MIDYLIDYLGWLATGVFIASYFFASPLMLRTLQMTGAVLWVAYGIIIGAPPVVVANVLVFAAAAWTAVRAHRDRVFARFISPRDSS